MQLRHDYMCTEQQEEEEQPIKVQMETQGEIKSKVEPSCLKSSPQIPPRNWNSLKRFFLLLFFWNAEKSRGD